MLMTCTLTLFEEKNKSIHIHVLERGHNYVLLLLPQFLAGNESINATLHDLGVDVLSSHHHQGCCV